MKNGWKISAMAAALIALLIAGCSRLAPPKDPYTLNVHMGAEPGTLNPITATDAYASSINQRIYETLVDRDYDTLKVIPQLAERWEISPDRLTFRFYLKKGVLWSDGVEFTADDVVYSYGKIMDPKVACAHLKVYYIDIKSCKKLGRYAVEFRYSRPYYLALIFCGGMPIVPKHIFNDGTDFNTHKNNRSPVGTGPYLFGGWETGKTITLVRNERYRDKKPEIKKVIYWLITEPGVALQMLKKGDLDMMGLRESNGCGRPARKNSTSAFTRRNTISRRSATLAGTRAASSSGTGASGWR